MFIVFHYESFFSQLVSFCLEVYKPLLSCIGEFPTVALGGLLRCLGFLGMSFATTPVLHPSGMLASMSKCNLRYAAAAIIQVVGGNLISPTTSSLLGKRLQDSKSRSSRWNDERKRLRPCDNLQEEFTGFNVIVDIRNKG